MPATPMQELETENLRLQDELVSSRADFQSSLVEALKLLDDELGEGESRLDVYGERDCYSTDSRVIDIFHGQGMVFPSTLLEPLLSASPMKKSQTRQLTG